MTFIRRVVGVVDSFIWWYIPWYRGPMPNDIYPDWRRLRHPTLTAKRETC